MAKDFNRFLLSDFFDKNDSVGGVRLCCNVCTKSFGYKDFYFAHDCFHLSIKKLASTPIIFSFAGGGVN